MRKQTPFFDFEKKIALQRLANTLLWLCPKMKPSQTLPII